MPKASEMFKFRNMDKAALDHFSGDDQEHIKRAVAGIIYLFDAAIPTHLWATVVASVVATIMSRSSRPERAWGVIKGHIDKHMPAVAEQALEDSEPAGRA